MGRDRLDERVRPRTLESVVGQSEAIERLLQLRAPDGTWGGRALLFSGDPGTGKTTLARIVAATTAPEPTYRWELNAGRLKVETLEDILRTIRHRGLHGGYAIILNEVHGLRTDMRRELLTVLEPGSEDGLFPWVVWCLTTTRMNLQHSFFDNEPRKKGEARSDDPRAFLSRCDHIALRGGPDRDLDFAIYLRGVGEREGLNGRPLADYIALVRRNERNLRSCLMEIEAGGMKGASNAA